MLLMHCEQLKDSNSSVEIFFEGNPALLGNITLFNTKANWFNTYNEIRYVDRKYVFDNSVLTLVWKHTLKVLAAVIQFLNSIFNNLMQYAPGKRLHSSNILFPQFCCWKMLISFSIFCFIILEFTTICCLDDQLWSCFVSNCTFWAASAVMVTRQQNLWVVAALGIIWRKPNWNDCNKMRIGGIRLFVLPAGPIKHSAAALSTI